MTTTPTLRDAAQAILANEGAVFIDQRLLDDLRAALAAPADALAEPVAWMDDGSTRNGSEGRDFRVVTARTKADMPRAAAQAYTTPLYPAPPATQLQQAVARAIEECTLICEDLADRACAAQEGPTDDPTNVMLRQVATLGARECAALIRAKGQQ